MKIAYVLKRYPRYSETFIVNEILAHEAAGLDITIFALRYPNDTHFQDSIARVAFSYDARVAADSHVEGFLLENSGPLRKLTDRQLGAGVYVDDEGVPRLVGLVSGRLQLQTADGTASYLTVIGPGELWRLLTHSRDLGRPRSVPNRGDVSP